MGPRRSGFLSSCMHIESGNLFADPQPFHGDYGTTPYRPHRATRVVGVQDSRQHNHPIPRRQATAKSFGHARRPCAPPLVFGIGLNILREGVMAVLDSSKA